MMIKSPQSMRCHEVVSFAFKHLRVRFCFINVDLSALWSRGSPPAHRIAFAFVAGKASDCSAWHIRIIISFHCHGSCHKYNCLLTSIDVLCSLFWFLGARADLVSALYNSIGDCKCCCNCCAGCRRYFTV